MTSLDAARTLSHRVLGEALPRRWSHVSGVAARAREIAPWLGVDGTILEAAAWLHDIGYAPDIVDTGFHPLDGARFLRTSNVDARIVGLVAYHSCAWIEAQERGLLTILDSEFSDEHTSTTDALCYCDMTTGPDGDRVEVQDRLDEIRNRYGPDALVTRFIKRAEPDILAPARRTESLLASTSLPS